VLKFNFQVALYSSHKSCPTLGELLEEFSGKREGKRELYKVHDKQVYLQILIERRMLLFMMWESAYNSAKLIQ